MMDAEPLRYPVATAEGRWSVGTVAVLVLAAAVGYRYAAATYSSPATVVPAGIILAATVLLLGYVATVVGVGEDDPPTPSINTLLQRGLLALGLLIPGLAPAVAVLALTVVVAPPEVPDSPSLWLLLGATVATILFGAAAYLFPAVLATRTDDETGWGLRRGLSIALHSRYLWWWIPGILLLAVGVAAAEASATGGGVVGLVAAFVSAFALLAGARAIGRGYASSRRLL